MRIKVAAAVFIICALFAAPSTARMGIGDRAVTPRVAYVEPKNQATIDITGKAGIVFRWNKVPIPSGGVQNYRFRVYKGFGYDVVASEEPDEGVFCTEVPAHIFDDGGVYTWKVQQRDARSMNWSQYDTWNFRVIKKNP